MSLKSRILKLEAKVKPLLSPIVVITMDGVSNPEDALLINQARAEGSEVLRVNIIILNLSSISSGESLYLE